MAEILQKLALRDGGVACRGVLLLQVTSKCAVDVDFVGVYNSATFFASGGDLRYWKSSFVAPLLPDSLPDFIAFSGNSSADCFCVIVVAFVNVILQAFEEKRLA